MRDDLSLNLGLKRRLNSLRVHEQRMKRLLFYAKGDKKKEKLLRAKLNEVKQSIGKIEK